MRAITLFKHGDPEEAFRTEEQIHPDPGPDEVVIAVEAFGLNFADVMARRGVYGDAPPLPFTPGYDVVGRIDSIGDSVEAELKGKRVVAMTRFGGYAEYVRTHKDGVAVIPEDLDAGKATALATQCCTAYFAAHSMANLREGEKVLIHSAPGGVGVALTQMARNKGCRIYGTTGSAWKLEAMEKQGVDRPIHREKENYANVIRDELEGSNLDVIFDPLGGKHFKKNLSLLAPAGRLVGFGGAERVGKKGPLATLRFILSFGFVHPGKVLMASRSIMGLNLLRIADHDPAKLREAVRQVVTMTEQGSLDPMVGGNYPAERIDEAHRALEDRTVTGKVAVHWGD
jgi:NADPH:quinone reductase-like Zn-dependent oxidoreductase